MVVPVVGLGSDTFDDNNYHDIDADLALVERMYVVVVVDAVDLDKVVSSVRGQHEADNRPLLKGTDHGTCCGFEVSLSLVAVAVAGFEAILSWVAVADSDLLPK